MKQYYINPAGTQEKLGPIAEDALKQALANGGYPMDSLVWCEGMPGWEPASSRFFSQAMPPLPQKPALRRASVMQQSPRLQPAGACYRACPSSHLGAAITGLVFSILACFFVPGIVLNIIAIARGSNVSFHWKNGDYTGAARSSSAAGTLTGWAWVVWCIWLFFLIFFSTH